MTRQAQTTNPGLLTEARHVVLPDGIVSSGMPAARATCAKVGLGLDPWQIGVARCILAKDAHGLYAADTVVLSIPRQVGKTYLIGALVFADCIINPGTTTVWTAHRFKVARETFNALKGTALSAPMVPHVDPEDIYTAAGNESITFRNGSRIVFAARERGAIRGFSKVRRLILDEAQILTEAAMADLAPTMNQAENPQMILMGTPPKPTDPGETFTNLRTEALAGQSEGVVYIEFAADPAAEMGDRKAWRDANPSYPHRTPGKAIERLRKLLSNDDDFRREALGIWVDEQSTKAALPYGAWLDMADPDAPRGTEAVFGVDVAEDRSAWVAVAWRRPDGAPQVMLADPDPVPAFRLVDRCVELGKRWSSPFVPPKAFEADLEREGVRIEPMKQGEFPVACGAFADAVAEGRIRHGNQPALNEAVRLARWRSAGTSGERAWQLKDAPEVGPLAAATRALHGLTAERVSVYEQRGLVQL